MWQRRVGCDPQGRAGWRTSPDGHIQGAFQVSLVAVTPERKLADVHAIATLRSRDRPADAIPPASVFDCRTRARCERHSDQRVSARPRQAGACRTGPRRSTRPPIRNWFAKTPALSRPLHADLRILAEPRGALVRRAHEQTIAARRASQRRTAQGGDPGVHRGASCEGHAVRVDQDHRRDSGQHCALRSANPRLPGAIYSADHAVRTLGSA